MLHLERVTLNAAHNAVCPHRTPLVRRDALSIDRAGVGFAAVAHAMPATTSPDARRWYVIHAKPKQETRAELNLRAWGLETLAPRIREYQPARGSRAAITRVAALFPGYLFARFDAGLLAEKVRLTRGVRRVVGFGPQLTPIEDAIIALIRGRVQDDGCVRVDEPRPGDRVEVIDGPLRSMMGVFDRSLSGGGRVMILLTTLGSSARVQLPRAWIRKPPTRFVA